MREVAKIQFKLTSLARRAEAVSNWFYGPDDPVQLRLADAVCGRARKMPADVGGQPRWHVHGRGAGAVHLPDILSTPR